MQSALKIDGVFQERGTVVSVRGEELTVRTRSGEFEARRAVSCLVRPEPDDVVLLAIPSEGALYVLAVLERAPDAELVLGSDRDLAVATKGTMRFSAAKGVEVRTAGTLDMIARSMRTTAVEAMVSVDRFGLVGRFVETHVETVKNTLGTMDSVLERLSQTVKRSYRFVEELDLTRAGEIEMRAKRAVHIRAQNALVDAEQLVKMQAEQIHLG